jgi:hypothetical protein
MGFTLQAAIATAMALGTAPFGKAAATVLISNPPA